MKKCLKRRDFLGRSALAALATASLGACAGRNDDHGETPREAQASLADEQDNFSKELANMRQMPRDLVLTTVPRAAFWL